MPNPVIEPKQRVDLNLYSVALSHDAQAGSFQLAFTPHDKGAKPVQAIDIPRDIFAESLGIQIEGNELVYGPVKSNGCLFSATHRLSLKTPRSMFKIEARLGGIGIADLRDGRIRAVFVELFAAPVHLLVQPGDSPTSIYLHISCFDVPGVRSTEADTEVGLIQPPFPNPPR